MDEGNEGKEGGGEEKIPEHKIPEKQTKNTCLFGLDKWSHWLDLGLSFYFLIFFSLFFWSIVVSFGFYGWDRVG